MDVDDEGFDVDIFQEPEGFYQPEKRPTYAEYRLVTGQVIKLRLVGHNPLWGHLLWNAGRTVTRFLEEHAGTLIKNKTVLELGAGAGLPSIVCALHGAEQVVVTDYPDVDLVANLQQNIEHSSPSLATTKIVAEGYLWGAPAEKLRSHLAVPESGFDRLILADLLFNHSEHDKLVTTITTNLKRDSAAQALVFFTPYRPWLYEKDMAFFEVARGHGLEVTKILEHVMDEVMFEEDPGDKLLRKTVFGYRLKWKV